jgi:hypothetical protein
MIYKILKKLIQKFIYLILKAKYFNYNYFLEKLKKKYFNMKFFYS